MSEFGRRGHVFALCIVFVVITSACDWSVAGFDAARSSYNAFEPAVTLKSAPNFRLSWTTGTRSIVLSGAVVSGGSLYVVDGQGLAVYPVDDTADCTGSPRTCSPVWEAAADSTASPVVANGIVYVDQSGGISAYDAAGRDGCTAGSARICSPLWTATASIFALPQLMVVKATLYVEGDREDVYAFDATGKTCTGTPRVCDPMWHASLKSANHLDVAGFAVADGELFTILWNGGLVAYDANGVMGCRGVPRTCRPLWSGGLETEFGTTRVAVSGGFVYVTSTTATEAFDISACRAAKSCDPTWSTDTIDGFELALTSNTLFVSNASSLAAYDTSSPHDCPGAPSICVSLGQTTNQPDPSGLFSPIIANDVLFATSGRSIVAFDAGGTQGCSGIPKACAPIAVLPLRSDGAYVSLLVANGALYVVDRAAARVDVYSLR